MPPTATLTATPVPTPSPLTFRPGDRIAGIDVATMTIDQARTTIETEVLPLALRPLDIRIGDANLSLSANDIGLQMPLDELMREAKDAAEAGQVVRVPFRVYYDREQVRSRVEQLAPAPSQATELMVQRTGPLDRTFTYRPEKWLDIEAALDQIDTRLQSLQAERRITIQLSQKPLSAERDLTILQAQIADMSKDWNGVVGFYLYDVASGNEIGLHEHSIFSGASIMKIPIMLQVFITLPKLTAEENEWLDKMIIDSDNKAANELLARLIGGLGTEDALAGVQLVNQTLRDLDLPYTYQSMPYEATDLLINQLGRDIYRGPELDGPEPRTLADPYIRTTPLEMGRLMAMIVQCNRGEGELLKRFPNMTSERCGEMLGRLRRNKDTSRIVAGLPPGTSVAHKSGWVEDMHADVAYVESPGGDFVAAMYVYREINVEENYLAAEVGAPAIASFARLVYSFYNPSPTP